MTDHFSPTLSLERWYGLSKSLPAFRASGNPSHVSDRNIATSHSTPIMGMSTKAGGTVRESQPYHSPPPLLAKGTKPFAHSSDILQHWISSLASKKRMYDSPKNPSGRSNPKRSCRSHSGSR